MFDIWKTWKSLTPLISSRKRSWLGDEGDLNVGCVECEVEVSAAVGSVQKDADAAVSYTHLTLPTNVSMCRSRWSPYH